MFLTPLVRVNTRALTFVSGLFFCSYNRFTISIESPFIQALTNRLTSTLPGHASHLHMGPSKMDAYYKIPEQHNKAAVMIPLYERDGILQTAFIKRSASNRDDKHSGQISFVGGKLEPSDESLEHCALRETEEEVGIPQNHIQVLGALTQIYVYVSNFLVQPYVGLVKSTPTFELQASEVADVIEVPLFDFIRTTEKELTSMNIRGRSIQGVPYFDLKGNILWGATSMIMNEFMDILKEERFHTY